MTRAEAEEIFIAVVMKDENAAVEMGAQEVQVFRVLIGKTLKEMEKKNRSLWLKARNYGIEYKAPYAVIKKVDSSRFKLFKIRDDGGLTPFERATSKSDVDEGKES